MSLSKKKRRAIRNNDLMIERGNSIQQKGMNIKPVYPKTYSQQATFDAYDSGSHLLLHGMAGTGKTFISMYLALSEIFNDIHSTHTNVTLIRSVVPTRDIGFLPGKEEDKIKVYEQPYKSICNELFRRGDAYDILKYKGIVNFMCTSFVRGLTLNDSIVIIDEVNNMNFHELDSVITRLGDNCRVIFCGDFRQSDLVKKQERDGLLNFMNILDSLNDFTHIEFDKNDIVRSALVKEYIIAREQLGLCA